MIWVNDSLGHQQETKFIPESDVYRLIIKSKLPQAEEFEIWLFEEVIPSIRKHGGYLTPQKIEEAILNPDTLIQLATTLKEEQEKNKTLTLVNKQQEQVINELKSKATYYDLILQCPDLLTITQIAKDYGKGGSWLNKILSDLKIQYKLRDTWLLYSNYSDELAIIRLNLKNLELSRGLNKSYFLFLKLLQRSRFL